jgi:hypothetical protein
MLLDYSTELEEKAAGLEAEVRRSERPVVADQQQARKPSHPETRG